MRKLAKRSIIGAVGAAAIGSASLIGAGTASAEVPLFCTVTSNFQTTAYSTCGTNGWHRVHITCWNWSAGSSNQFYERWGNPVEFGGQQSISSCDLPLSLRSADIAYG
ncbi:hypothetical protein [Antrihabitans stalactiti]|uniref:Uncharacterized protein n=1 Tax=Antrihabitans stalactiti TaxID=2584121 RepID=A0A848KIJ2_9NOCA|nr:hypothetical protein [Antrihabitans stalactiti]NMN98525.1 hypothetical protein [Antrihabitans stalactiti]